MQLSIDIESLNYAVSDGRTLLSNLNMTIPAGSFIALLGENGAGKTTLMELLMGFKRPKSGKISLGNTDASTDPFDLRHHIVYLSEKMGLPGDWTVRQFLDFHRYFYPKYSIDRENELLRLFRINPISPIFNLSAGETKRVQVVASLSIQPSLILVDEITAVLDIIGRKLFLDLISQTRVTSGATVVLATNILEDLVQHISHVALIQKGQLRLFSDLPSFLGARSKSDFSALVAEKLGES